MIHMLFDSSNVPEMNTFQNYQLKHTVEIHLHRTPKSGQKVQLWTNYTDFLKSINLE